MRNTKPKTVKGKTIAITPLKLITFFDNADYIARKNKKHLDRMKEKDIRNGVWRYE